ncbi:MAG: hypothetical protein H7256_02865 [Bdellovibrio sp.]|nr:hypothetical protein [Bdellovibrio sp.]
MTKYLMILSLLLCFSCSKKDPHPESKDEIYSDLLAEQDIMTKSVDAAEKELVNMEKALKGAVPQTGQLKQMEIKFFESKNIFEKLKQQKQYFDIKVEERKQEVGLRYEESLTKSGRKWPDPKEIEIYKQRLKMYRDKIAWDKNKGIVKAKPKTAVGAPVGGHGAAPSAAEHRAAAEPPPEHN